MATASRSAFITGRALSRAAPTRARRTVKAGVVRAAKEGRQSLFVTVTVKEGKMDEYNELIQGHITNCFANDRCMYFDYGIPVDGDPNVVHLYEVYEDEAAYKEHKASAHLKDYVEKAEALTSSTTTVKLLTLAQYGSVNCNYAGECELSGEWD